MAVEFMAPFEALPCALAGAIAMPATLETLATIKNPPIVIARYGNIAHGPARGNNNGPATPSRARNLEPRQLNY
ncbi:MAG: hypothetical protein IPI06_15435 [Gammaproteobacteria bacterium]|nr:hypothetical protein [Gammaproteobacteria bacterium]